MSTIQREELSRRRLNAITRRIACFKHDLGERLRESKRIFGQRVYAVDIHTHSNHSDGCGTVEENYEAAQNAGLDFMFATDHASLGQKRPLKKLPRASWGQEPGAGGQHIGLLHGRRLFVPKRECFADDFRTAEGLGAFAWVPHPVGWYPSTWYRDELVDLLWTLEKPFAVEVMNAAAKTFRAYDAFDQKAIGTWDQLLCAGRRITALGGSDAHCPDDIGSVWTGVYAARCSAASILRALNQGHCFASEASLLDLRCNRQSMGRTLNAGRGRRLCLRYRVADAGGIASVRIIRNGKVVKEVAGKLQSLVAGAYERKMTSRPAYYRLESTAFDDRRAFSTPIYVTCG